MAGIGRAQLAANGLGLILADGVRVGLEDNLWLDHARSHPATNLEQVSRVLRLASEFDRMTMDRPVLRERLGVMPVQARLMISGSPMRTSSSGHFHRAASQFSGGASYIDAVGLCIRYNYGSGTNETALCDRNTIAHHSTKA